MTHTEYIIWGVKPNETEEEILYTKATTMDQAKKVIELLELVHKCTGTRIQTLNLGACPSQQWNNKNLIN